MLTLTPPLVLLQVLRRMQHHYFWPYLFLECSLMPSWHHHEHLVHEHQQLVPGAARSRRAHLYSRQASLLSGLELPQVPEYYCQLQL